MAGSGKLAIDGGEPVRKDFLPFHRAVVRAGRGERDY